MDEQQENRPRNPRRRKRTQLQILKEDYLPVVIAGIALILILVFIVGSIVRAVQKKKYEAMLKTESSIAAQQEQDRLNDELNRLISEAAELAKHFDYDSAIAVLDQFSGNMYDFANLSDRYTEYVTANKNLILWENPAEVLNLSFQPLIADSVRAYADSTYGTSYYNNYITVTEFSKILLQLYENGYILVGLDDIDTENGMMHLRLPEGKKPLIITETHVNYNTYMIDGDGDKLPDKDGAGFASKLILDENGKLTCEMVDSTGSTVTGAYDIVPILDAFVEAHPDFSYKGAKAVLALTGYDGLFGYRTSSSAADFFGQAFHNQEVAAVKKVIEAVKKAGYELACYSYDNEPYENLTVDQIKTEMKKWNDEVVPLLGAVDTFVFCRNSDIAENSVAYTDEKYQAISSNGFTKYIGFSKDGNKWYNDYGNYIRMGRILVTGSNIKNNSSWFNGIFDPYSVLDASRNK